MNAAIVGHSIAQFICMGVLATLVGFAVFQACCMAHDVRAQRRRDRDIRSYRNPWAATPAVFFLTERGHPNGWVVGIPFLLFAAAWLTLTVGRPKMRRRRLLRRIRAARAGIGAVPLTKDQERVLDKSLGDLRAAERLIGPRR